MKKLLIWLETKRLKATSHTEYATYTTVINHIKETYDT
jgi:hypothetical protein